MADTELQRLIIYVGTTAQIEAAIQAGTITENDLAISTDAPDFQEKLTDVQMNAVNSGITTQLVSLYSGHVADTTIHVTAQDKTNWNGKQNAISDLNTIRSNAQAGKSASDMIAGYGNIVTHNVSEFATSAQGAKADSALQQTDIVNNTSSTATNKALSANMGKSLQDQVDNLKARGRFLALWNCATGLAESNPPSGTYTYQSGDYFIIGVVAQAGQNNYKPDGSTYTTGVASTVIETQPVDTDDVYYYDGHVWRLQVNTQKEIGFVNIAGSPYDNSNLASALNDKQDNLPNQSGNSGKFLTTNGSAMSWATVDALPSQTGQSGKYLTTNGVSASWGTIDFSNYVTLNTNQTITGQKTFLRTETAFQDSVARFVSTYNSSNAGWRGRVIIGAKDYTFLIGTYNGMAAIGGHKFSDSATESNADWSDIYFQPDGAKAVYIGGYSWTPQSGWFKVQNAGGNTGGKAQINIGSISSANWKDIAYKGENISDFNNDSGFITGITSSDVTTALGYTPLSSAAIFYWGE